MTKEQNADYYYEHATEEEVRNILKKATWKIVEKTNIDDIADDGEANFVQSMYSVRQTFGATDYKDHREDKLEEIRKVIEKGMIERPQQRLNYYDKDGNPLKEFGVKGYLGGYTGYFLTKSWIVSRRENN